MNEVTRKLIAKEFHVNRVLIAIGAVAGVASMGLAATGKIGFNVGALTWISTLVAVGVMLALYGILNERKENSLLFVLSLPLSIADYVRAKQLGLLAAFFVPWLISSLAAALLVIAHPDAPHGLLPFVVLLTVFLFTNYSVVLCGALHAKTEALVTGMVIVTNMAVTLFIFVVGGIEDIGRPMWGPVPVWNPAFWTVLGFELAILAITLVLPHLVAARRRDFL